jgi:hypothetical protein
VDGDTIKELVLPKELCWALLQEPYKGKQINERPYAVA